MKLECFLIEMILVQVLGLLPALSVASDFQQVVPLDGSEPKRFVFRGSRPIDADYSELKTLGVKNVLTLENFDVQVLPWEELGMRTFFAPLPSLLPRPSEAALDEIVQILKEPSSYPLYIHCKPGEDRTGVAVALYRVIVEGSEPEIAYKEMLIAGLLKDVDSEIRCAFYNVLDLPHPKRCKLIPRRRIQLKFDND